MEVAWNLREICGYFFWPRFSGWIRRKFEDIFTSKRLEVRREISDFRTRSSAVWLFSRRNYFLEPAYSRRTGTLCRKNRRLCRLCGPFHVIMAWSLAGNCLKFALLMKFSNGRLSLLPFETIALAEVFCGNRLLHAGLPTNFLEYLFHLELALFAETRQFFADTRLISRRNSLIFWRVKDADILESRDVVVEFAGKSAIYADSIIVVAIFTSWPSEILAGNLRLFTS
jgi:hypothetical protein